MRIVCVSDTHLLTPTLPEGDMLIHAGDLCIGGWLRELEEGLAWLDRQPHKYKILIPGNHDRVLEGRYERYQDHMKARVLLEQTTNLYYLCDAGAKVGGLSVYGMPWTSPFNNWAFNADEREREVFCRAIPAGTDILVTHGPPWGVLDRTMLAGNVGCDYLLRAVERVRPRLHVFGHIHESYGTETIGGIKFVNAAICAGPFSRLAQNEPIVVDLEDPE